MENVDEMWVTYGKEWKSNRYFILVMAAAVNFVHGNPYIWTVFQPYMKKEFDVSTAVSSLPFTLIIAVFAFGNMIGGWLQHKIGAKKTILAGSAFMCAGFLMAALAPIDAPWDGFAGIWNHRRPWDPDVRSACWWRSRRDGFG